MLPHSADQSSSRSPRRHCHGFTNRPSLLPLATRAFTPLAPRFQVFFVATAADSVSRIPSDLTDVGCAGHLAGPPWLHAFRLPPLPERVFVECPLGTLTARLEGAGDIAGLGVLGQPPFGVRQAGLSTCSKSRAARRPNFGVAPEYLALWATDRSVGSAVLGDREVPRWRATGLLSAATFAKRPRLATLGQSC